MRARIHKAGGFTLIEMVTVIVLLGIIVGILTPFIAKAMQAYTHSKARASLVDKGRLAMERLAREVRVAVPNSLVVLNAGSGIEFIRSRAGGRYVARFENFGTEFSQQTRRFRKNADTNELYVLGRELVYNSGDTLVIGNTSPAQLMAGNSTAALAGVSATTNAGAGSDGTLNGQVVSFAAQQFNMDSPGHHYSIADKTIEIGLSGTQLHWYRAPVSAYNASKNWSSADPVLVNGVSAVNFSYTAGTPQSTAVLRVDMTLTDIADQSIRLYREIHVRNTP
jgi:MSHA biogenesis protein MshO